MFELTIEKRPACAGGEDERQERIRIAAALRSVAHEIERGPVAPSNAIKSAPGGIHEAEVIGSYAFLPGAQNFRS